MTKLKEIKKPAPAKKVVYVAIILGGRGEGKILKFDVNVANIDFNKEEDVYRLLDGDFTDDWTIRPNTDDKIPAMIKAMQGKTKMWYGWDADGDGFVGVTANPNLRKELVRKMKDEWTNLEDDDEW